MAYLAAGPLGLRFLHPVAYSLSSAEMSESGSPFVADPLIPVIVIACYGVAGWLSRRWARHALLTALPSLAGFILWTAGFKGVLHMIATVSEPSSPWAYIVQFGAVDWGVGLLASLGAVGGWMLGQRGL